ncbi:MAG TPA: RNA polymerase sigma factor [Steroidobacteraceae bacterium]|nr:RNA polymerase sigma factor [Steroidobacteraceae bacterium]
MTESIEQVFRREYGRAVAVLVRQLGDISLAEEAVQDAFATAVERWPVSGVPPSPAGWIIVTARNRAIDRLRREATRDERQQAAMEMLESVTEQEHEVPDERLRLIFTCCHPALSVESQLALTLRLLAGLTTAEIARAFLVPEPTMAQRISRAKAKIHATGIPYRVPDAAELPLRLGSVLAAVYLIFNEGYSATSGEELQRGELIDEALRLGRLLRDLLPDDEEVAGLLALMLLTDARRDARSDADGAFVRLADQDRKRWDRARIDEGQALVRACLARNRPGPYQLQAAINAVHSDAREARDTDWRQILALYDQLMALTPNPVVALNRAVAVAELEGPVKALMLVDELQLQRYHLWHAVRAELLARAGRLAESESAYKAALTLCENGREREYIEKKLRTK